MNTFSQRYPQGDLYQRDSRCAIDHFGDAASDSTVYLDDPRSVRRELDLGVQAAGRHAKRLDGGCCEC